ncbi:Wzz/FepE/Etk N-terminal domain-containing protein [Homoserinibacter sp. YIM 151385]|uniref:Wzz/FepE/Etk N-terminal domain-containing protein n=1 Tax=Homoserinibacter sp. YIM 151385 TaxID=2985506 RepID=UPI0022F042BB|nr:Wzz/FepE/Etk N-terminal domain-containing protein [Homoserinibacter sp. YIM 151385]WBU38839.1 Wzz/FepE/Etk N-terminal domain-containing protein [Homoserinibacter sp. YIM 151385]
MVEPAAPLTLDEAARRVVRERRLLIAVILVAVLAAGVIGFLWPSRYEATATLTVEPVAVVDPGSSATVNMETERVVATSTEVLGPAAESLGGTSPEALAGALEVLVPRGSQVLEFTVTDAVPARAAEAANAIAESYREQRVANAEGIVQQAESNLTDRIAELEARLDGTADDSATARSLELQIQTLQERLALVVSNTFYPGSVVSPATTPTDATKPSILIFLAGGAFLGLLVGVFAALLRRRPEDAVPAPAPAPAPAAATPAAAEADAAASVTASPAASPEAPAAEPEAGKAAGKPAEGEPAPAPRATPAKRAPAKRTGGTTAKRPSRGASKPGRS